MVAPVSIPLAHFTANVHQEELALIVEMVSCHGNKKTMRLAAEKKCIFYAPAIQRIVERADSVTPVHLSPSASDVSSLHLSFSGGGISTDCRNGKLPYEKKRLALGGKKLQFPAFFG